MASRLLRPCTRALTHQTSPKQSTLRPTVQHIRPASTFLSPTSQHTAHQASRPPTLAKRTYAQAMPSEAQEIKEEDVAEWKKRAPYHIHTKNEGFKTVYDAACHCGKVKYQLSRDAPLDSKLCHCTTCQTQHAAPFQWAAIFHKDDINFSHGHHDLEWYDPTEKTTEHKLPCKVRCSFCHSPIMDEGRNMILLFPSLINLNTQEAKDKFKPRCHIFYSQRVMDIPDGIPKWTKIDKTSDLIEDSPPEMVQELERQRKKQMDSQIQNREVTMDQ